MTLLTIGRYIAILCIALGFSLPVQAQGLTARDFPPNTKRGVLDMSAYPTVMMDKVVRNTAPGMRIYNIDNLTVSPGTLDSSSTIVNYVESNYGDIEKIWILTQVEISKVLPPAEVWKPRPFTSSN